MNAIIRPKKGPGPFTVIAHAKGIIKNKSGRRKWGGFPSRAAAEEWRAEVWLCLRRGMDPIVLTQGGEVGGPEGGVTFGEFVETLAAQWRNEDFKHKTLETYLSIALNQLAPAFGSISLPRLEAGAIGDYFARMRSEGRTDKTIKNHRSLLNVILAEAGERGLIEKNPMPPLPRHRRGKRRASSRRKKHETWLLADLITALNAAPALEPTHAPAVTTMGLVPLRVNELLGLQWADLDTRSQHITVRRTRTATNVVEELTKTGEERTIDVPDTLQEILLEHRAEEVLEGRGRDTDWMFCEPNGHPMRWDGLNKTFRRLHETLGLKPIRFSWLRHTWATLHLRELRSPIQWVSSQMGHSDISITANLYGYVAIDSDPGLANRLGEMKEAAEASATPDDPETTLEGRPIHESPYKSRKGMVELTGIEPVTS